MERVVCVEKLFSMKHFFVKWKGFMFEKKLIKSGLIDYKWIAVTQTIVNIAAITATQS